MRFHTQAKRLKDAKALLESIPFRFGPNKKQELLRLFYEISKIKNTSPSKLLKKAIKDNEFQDAKQAFIYLKEYFLKERFPKAYKDKGNFKFYLPKINIDERFVVSGNKPRRFYPKRIFIEEEAKDYSLTKSILLFFPLARKISIKRIKDYTEVHRRGSLIDDYNKRSENLFLIKERYDFLKPCPCSRGVVGCGYYILNLGFGCISECSYCFLQSYTNVSGIVIPVNIGDFLSALEKFLKNNKRNIRIGTGEFTDSLALDDLTGFSRVLIEFFSKVDNATLELKTKSSKIENILDLEHNRNTVISWSLNPQSLIDSDEWRSSIFKERLKAAQRCCEMGYLVGFHFDPIIYSAEWEVLYKEVVERLFEEIAPGNIAWISLGTFRFSPSLKTVIEQRFPESKILDQELVLDFDRKLRYTPKQKVDIYKKMYSWIKRYSNNKALVYLCMEPKEIWQEVLGRGRF